MLKIQPLRAKAEIQLADKVNICECHNALLEIEPLPLRLPERIIDDGIASKRT